MTGPECAKSRGAEEGSQCPGQFHRRLSQYQELDQKGRGHRTKADPTRQVDGGSASHQLDQPGAGRCCLLARESRTPADVLTALLMDRCLAHGAGARDPAGKEIGADGAASLDERQSRSRLVFIHVGFVLSIRQLWNRTQASRL